MDKTNRESQIKRAARASAARRKQQSQPEDNFRPHPTYPKINVGEERKKPRRVRKVRLASTGSVAVGSRVSRGFGYGLLSDIKNGRIPSFLGLIAMLLLGYWLLTAPNFRVTNVVVKNGRFLDAKDVISATAVDQQNIFLLNEDEVANKLKKLPYVLEAQVSRSLPNNLTVEVKERASMLNWRVGSTNYLVDPDGVILESYVQLPGNAASYTVIRSLDDKQLRIGDKVDPVAVRSAPAMKKKLEEIGFGTTSLDYSPTNGLIAMGIKEQGSRKIVLGTDAELDKKMGILKALMADQNLKWTFADLRFTAKPAIQ
jgi:hypothetical protein